MREVGDTDARGKDRVQTINEDPSLTVQSEQQLTDVRTILKQYGVQAFDSLENADMLFMDVTEFTDYGDAIRHAKFAEVEFLKMPSKVREIFDHDVAVWLDTAHDEDKRDALVQAGFLEASEVDDPPGTGGAPPQVADPPEPDPAGGSDEGGDTGSPGS